MKSGYVSSTQVSRPRSGPSDEPRPISPKSKAAQTGTVKAVPLFQLVPLRRKNKEGGGSSNSNGMHSRTCESDSEDTVLSLSPIKLLECRASPCTADRRPSDSSVKSMGSLGSKSRRKDSTPKSRPRLSLQAALASEGQPKHRSSSRISASTEPDRRLNVPGIEGGGASYRASPGSTSAARTSAVDKDGRGKDKRKDRDMEMKLGIEREKLKETERLRDLEVENERVRELEREIERERIKDQERARELEEENNEVERQKDHVEIGEEQDNEGEEEREIGRIAVVEEEAVIETDVASGQSPGTSNNSSLRIIKKASTSSSVSTLATSSCSDKCVRDNKEPSAGEVE